MRTRWSSPQWRFLATKPVLKVQYKDGMLQDLTVMQALMLDPTDVESCSIYEPNNEPITQKDKQAYDSCIFLLDTWQSCRIPIRETPM